MAYRFNAEQPVPHEVRRILLEEIDSAVDELTKHKNKDRDESIHEARKSVKKVRGLLRLVAPLIGKGTFRKENEHLRGIGRKLSELRDACAIIEIFEAVVKEAEPQKLLADDLVQLLRGRLEEHKSATEQKINVEETLGSAVAALGTTREHVKGYQLDGAGFEGLERGLINVYRRGRKAMKQAGKAQDAVGFHNWRKRVKDHWYHVRLLGGLNTAFLQTREDDLKKLETWLGDDHNLVVLRDTINNKASFGHPKQVRQFLAIAKQHGGELRDKALDLGQHLYGLKPKQLLGELAAARDAWPVPSNGLRPDSGSQNASLNLELQSESPKIAANGSATARQPRKKAGSAPSQRSRARARA
ncbi:MAG: CHAD domain-containing protein [Acidobacteriaceae bacterium]|nr:CHAD domain-containing protein [Acidobacteriaceae bacterium]MBV9304849.1 CHAD domain-containing protein [Acidobacteriaceae bacterium]